MSNTAMARAWVELDLDALRANYLALRRRVGTAVAVIPMVKADAYGVGAARVVRILEPLDPWGYGVATVEEGVLLRGLGVRRRIVVFTPLPPGSVAMAAAGRLTASLSDLAGLERWARAAAAHGPLDFHVEIDTGMGRAGFDWRQTGEWAPAVRDGMGAQLRWRGAFTHFQGADAADPSPTATQWQRFEDAVAQLPVSREDLLLHAANSAAALRWPEYAADAVRPGIFLYGGRAGDAAAGVPAPEPVVRVRSRLVLVRAVSPGSTVGYGATHQSRGWERWGTVAIGYGDGLPRALSNRGEALVRGHRVPLVGRISMDMTVVDITAVPDAEVGDVVTLIGAEGEEEITVDEVAGQAGTIAYEVLTGLTGRLPRVEPG